jgi:hypothetical protein
LVGQSRELVVFDAKDLEMREFAQRVGERRELVVLQSDLPQLDEPAKRIGENPFQRVAREREREENARTMGSQSAALSKRTGNLPV